MGLLCVCKQTGNVYKNVKRKIERCVAFPTCLSVNSVVCHFSPMESVVSAIILKLMFVSLVGCSDMACHIDGFIAVVAHTHVLQEGYCKASVDCRESTEVITDVDCSSPCGREKSDEDGDNDDMLGDVFDFSEEGMNLNQLPFDFNDIQFSYS